jgi:hypothetical protein
VQVPDDKTSKRNGPGTLLLWSIAALVFYVLSTGPVAWATNDGLHDRYLPPEVELIYLPLYPLLKIPWVNKLHYYYTAVIWGGWPEGYTTL